MSICTDAFTVPARAMADLYGFPGYQFLTVPHPIASLDAGQLRTLAAGVLPGLLQILGTDS